jgi:hypothetical protein
MILNNPPAIETLDNIPNDEFVDKYGMEKVDYDGPKSLDPASAISAIKYISEHNEIHPYERERLDFSLAPFTNLLYQAELGIKNKDRFNRDMDYIFAPDSTDAYDFLRENQFIVGKGISNIGKIRILRNSFLWLMSDRALDQIGFLRDIGPMPENSINIAREFVMRFARYDEEALHWIKPRDIKNIYANVFY